MPPVCLSEWKVNERLTCETRQGGEGKRFTYTHAENRLELLLYSPYGVDWNDRFRENPHRVPVDVLYDNTVDGYIWPLVIYADEGMKLTVDELYHAGQGACMEAGIQGVRYVCDIHGRILQVYLDGLFWIVSRTNLDYVLAGQTSTR